MNLLNTLIDLHDRGIELDRVDGNLKIAFRRDGLPEDLKLYLKTHKSRILDLLERLGIDSNRDVRHASFAQQRLWMLERIESASGQYNMPVALHLDGDLNVGALERTLDTLLERHEVLRTVYGTDDDGDCVQIVRRASAVELAHIDLSDEAEDARVARAEQLAREEAAAPFDLSTDRMLRATLLRLAPRTHVLLVTLHHIASDGWSMGVLTREIGELYNAYVQGLPNPLEPLRIQYKDYASWQRRDARSPTRERDLAYWTAALHDLPTVHNLPLDRPRPALADHRSGQIVRHLDASRHRDLLQFASSRQATLFMVLQAAFAAFLSRLSGTADVVVGSPVANRPRPELAPIVGFFVNTLVLRSRVDPDLSFHALLLQSRQRLLDAYEHQQLPFEQLVDAINPARSLAHAPLFQVMLSLNNNDSPPLHLAGLHARSLGNPVIPAKFDLSLQIDSLPDGRLRLVWEYACALFEHDTVSRFAERFDSLVADALRRPDTPVAQLDLLPDDERRLLQRWNRTAAPYPELACIHRLFEEQADRFPQRIALHCNGVALTYRELNARANRLAHLLRPLGLAPDSLVGVCLERSTELVVSLLAVLKAGSAYLPLDPAYPRERIDYMLRDSRAQCVIASRSFALAGDSTVRHVVHLDDPGLVDRLGRAPDHNPDPADVGLAPHHLAYLIYTSGSTGSPKGVMIEHRNAVSFIDWARRAFPPESFDGVLASTSVCFDLSVFEIFATLAAAGRIVLVRDVLALPELPDGLVRLVNSVPSAIHALLQTGRLPASVRTVNLAGEPLRQSLVDALYDAGVERVYDLYGPSEDTTYSTCALRTPRGRPSIGSPISNTQAFVLSAAGQLQPVGVPGELFLGGAGLARGYLGRPELTAERFVDNPLHDSPVRRLYRTGDLVRWLPDGQLEFLGRLDHQVKIRGFRIELGEIDARLGACDGVREAAVIALERAGDAQLVAYVVPHDPQAASAANLRAALAAFLPAYMIPAAFVFLDALPLTPNGKLDRKRLPVPDDARASSRDSEPPRGPTETAVAAVWQTLLDYAPVGRHDHFFEMGGHSLTALKLLDHLAKRFAVPLTAAMLFRSPSIEQLAREIDAARTGHDVEPPVERFRDGAAAVAPLLLVPPIGGSSLCYGDLVNALDYPGVVWGCQQTREIVAAETTGSAAGLAALYARAWLERAEHAEVCLLGWSFGGVVGFEMAGELEKHGVKVRWLGLIDTHLSVPGGETLGRQALATFALDLGFAADELAQWKHLVPDGDIDGEESDALRHLWTIGRDTGRLPAAITLDELTERYRITAANLRRLAGYLPRPAWQGPADYFLAARDAQAAAARRSADVWRTRLPELAVTDVDADHFSIVKSRHAQAIARLVTLKLEELIPA
ncbi:non-ribosomal peptide synthetase [Burkholderia sp. MSMB0265]|uniref:non-ribosomal peptide synthetase n=1 Tax=Burkholderia sp. MSMB0265 TaxID=1637836 RepID=UPI00075CE017|nr:non-ribosomal peptide synthetase [Burkholderia sp. MSMB0265]KVG45651.1 hypothetical protein WS77_05980 [Burkholderia sp. MSMB0265]